MGAIEKSVLAGLVQYKDKCIMSQLRTIVVPQPAAGGESTVRETRFDPPHEIAARVESTRLFRQTKKLNRQTLSKRFTPRWPPMQRWKNYHMHRRSSSGFMPSNSFPIWTSGNAIWIGARRNCTRGWRSMNRVLRNARLWFQERHHDLLNRQAELEEHDRQLSERLAEFDKRLEAESSATHAALGIQQEQGQALSVKQDELSVRELELQQRQAAVEELAAGVAQRSDLCEQQEQAILFARKVLPPQKLCSPADWWNWKTNENA